LEGRKKREKPNETKKSSRFSNSTRKILDGL